MLSITCEHDIYNNTNMNKKNRFQNTQSYMCTYYIQQKKHKHKVYLTKFPVLYFYIPSKTIPTQTQRLVTKIPSITCVHNLYKNTNMNTKDCCKIPSLACVHTLYNNTNINTEACCKTYQSYMCTYPLKIYIYKLEGSFPNIQFYMCAYPLYMFTHPLQKRKREQEVYLPKFPVLYV